MNWAKGLGTIAGLFALASAVLLFLADTSIGHRFIVDRIAAQQLQSGLQIRIGRIEGSIFGKAQLRQLQLSDPEGLFFETPQATVDWSPFAWISNRLDITTLAAKSATLHRLPRLRPTQQKRSILPDFDIRVGRFAITRLVIGKAVAGETRSATLAGTLDIRAGRALVKLDADASKGDRLSLLLNAEPDRDRFDAALILDAKQGGVFSAMLGSVRPMSIRLTGKGSWVDWRGQLDATVSGADVADIMLIAQSGRYALAGRVAPAALLKGKLQRLTSPHVAIRGEGRLVRRRLDAHLSLASAALLVDASGVINLGTNAFDTMLIEARLRQPQALFPNMTGSDIAMKVRLDGPFTRARFDYLLTTSRVAFDQTGLEEVRASGQGRLSASPVQMPVGLTVRRVTGVGDVAGGILSNISVNGLLLVTGKAITGDDLLLKSDKLSGKISLFVDLVTGIYDVGLAGQLTRYLIPGLGIVDVKSELKAVPGINGRGMRIVGHGQAWVRRFDNGFLASLAGGLPQLDTQLERGPDGILSFTNLKLTAPALRLVGNGYRRRDGSFVFEGAGTQNRYGPLRLVLDGRIERPKLDIMFASPNAALGLLDVRLMLDPQPAGFMWTARGGSTLGPFTGNGAIQLLLGKPAIIVVDALNVAGSRGTGQLTSLNGGFGGQIKLDGGGISGRLDFAPEGQAQKITAKLNMRDARFEGPQVFTARRGQVDGVIRLDQAGAMVDATMTGEGLQYGPVSLARFAGNINLKGGSGVVRAALAGSRGRSFDLQIVSQITPGRFEISGDGKIDRKPIRLAQPLILAREPGGWRMQPASVEFAGGTARVAGLFGGAAPEIEGNVRQMPMTILDLFFPRLGLGGFASGSFSYRGSTSGQPIGKADLNIRGLSRSGLVLSSRPIDLGVAAVLNGNRAGARLVAASGGQTVGRAQIQLNNIQSHGDMADRIMNAPIVAQLRYNGAADTLWRLAAVETFDLSGTVAIGADISGRLNNPRIRGSLQTANARVESAATGMVLTGVAASGSFNGSQLVINRFSATAGKGGTVTGTGSFDFASTTPGIDLVMQANQAQLIARDDIAATITGPLTIKSDGNGGLISGTVTLDRSRFRLGQATTDARIPRLNVREINGRMDRVVKSIPLRPWRLAVKAAAPGRLMVAGLGIESEWRADLDIGGTIFAPAILGRADLVRGDYEFSGRRFELARGTIRFQGLSPPDPVLDIVAQGDTQGLNATIRVSGTGQRPEIAFTSIPSLPQDELLSRLLFGTSITNLSAPEAVQLAAAVAALRSGGTGLNPINAVRQAIGLDRLRILPADTVTGQRTSIAAGKYLSRRTYVEIITDGQGYSATRAEFQVTRWLSLLSSISTIGRQSVTVRVSKDY